MNDRPVMLIVTAATRDEAENLGEALLTAGLAKRGSVIPGIHSFQILDGRLDRSHEAMLLVTTSTAQVAEATAYIRAHHSFEEPQIITLQLAAETAG
jgi:periplasmic divalent cation tolerance protein